MFETIFNYLIAGVLALIAGFPIFKMKVNQLEKKTEKQEQQIEELKSKDVAYKLELATARNEFSERLIEVFSQHAKSQNNALLLVTETHNKTLEKVTDKFTDAYKEIAKINVQSEDYLDKKLDGVYKEIKGVKEGQVDLVSAFKEDIHNLEIKIIKDKNRTALGV